MASLRALGWLRRRPLCLSSLLSVVCPPPSDQPATQPILAAVPTSGTCVGWSWNHSALEHFVSDGSGNLVDESGAHLRIGFQHLESFLFHLRFRSLALLGSVLPQLLTGRCLVLLDDLVGNLVHDRELLSVYGCAKQSDRGRKQGYKYKFFKHGAILPH